jgi:predicted MFS family arabinose efflux permease
VEEVKSADFTSYQKQVVALLAFLQFTVILDFMILSPLGAILLPELHITTSQFGVVVSAYAFSACAAGILSAGFADRFDRKQLLLVFYAGFLLGTLFCGLAPTYGFLLAARVFTGLFGGVIGSISQAIVADLFPLAARGRVMGSIQSAFAASQVMGLPIGLYLAAHLGWHGPFLLIVVVGVLVGVVMMKVLRPLTGHLVAGPPQNPFRHLAATATRPRYLVGFFAVMLVATGGFMLMPFSSAFSVNNLGIPLEKLPMLYMASGAVGLVGGPLLGRLADKIGKFQMFAIASVFGALWTLWYTGLGPTPIGIVMAANCCFSLVISARMSSISALLSAVPSPTDRGAYMAVSSSMQQLAGGASAWAAGLVVVQTASGRLERFHTLGFIVVGAMAVSLAQMYVVHRMLARPAPVAPAAPSPPPSAATEEPSPS